MDDPLIGYQLANYRIERLIGRGGMAQVYYGWDVELQRPVAVKVIDARYRNNTAFASRFVREARTVAGWRHENVLQVHYAGEQDGLYFFAMEYVDGLDLGQILARYAAAGELMPYDDVLRIGQAIAAALDYAHRRGVIHRDMKPSNVMVAADGRVTLADFGLALDVQQGSMGEIFGSPRYVAPEQARRSTDAVPQSDLYSLGVILYEMLTGTVPFDDPSPTSMALQHLTMPPPSPRSFNPDLSPACERVLLKALSKSPQERFQSGRELMDALEAALGEGEAASTGPQAVSATSTPATGRGAKWPTTLLAAGAGLLILACLGLLAAAALQFRGREDSQAEIEVPMPTATVRVEVPFPAGTEPAADSSSPADTPPSTVMATVTMAASTIPTLVSPSATPSATPTASSTPAPSLTPVPSSTPVIEPSATVLYPGGHPLTLFYDDYGFYVWNPPGVKITVQPLAFEALNEDGSPAGVRFAGWRWSQYYPYLEGGNCVRIEMLAAPSYLRPAQCRRYNAQVSSEADSDLVFWVLRPGVVGFRVLWNEQEVGRCEFGAESCQVFLP
jgi:tRNA A-37 threonylcarbamoyl transferase component Bud32